MEAIVMVSSVLRAFLVMFLLSINCGCMAKLVCQGKRSAGVHNVITGAVYLSSMIYLSTWIPFVLYGLFNGTTLYLASDKYCKMQYMITSSLCILLLVLLLVHKIEKIRVELLRKSPLYCESVVVLITILWSFSELLWSVHGRGISEASFHFLDDVTQSRLKNGTQIQCKIGFLICEVDLFPDTLYDRCIQYLYTVLPLVFLIVCCAFVQCVCRCPDNCNSSSAELSVVTEDGACRPGCSQLVVIDLVLFANLLWLFLIQPLMLAHVRMHYSGSTVAGSYVDVGSHLVLTIAAVFAPMNGRENWFSSRRVPIKIFVVRENLEKPLPIDNQIQTKV